MRSPSRSHQRRSQREQLCIVRCVSPSDTSISTKLERHSGQRIELPLRKDGFPSKLPIGAVEGFLEFGNYQERSVNRYTTVTKLNAAWARMAGPSRPAR